MIMIMCNLLIYRSSVASLRIWPLAVWQSLVMEVLVSVANLLAHYMYNIVILTKIIPTPNYFTRQMLGFLSLYKDQNTVFIIFYLILLAAVLWN